MDFLIVGFRMLEAIMLFWNYFNPIYVCSNSFVSFCCARIYEGCQCILWPVYSLISPTMESGNWERGLSLSPLQVLPSNMGLLLYKQHKINQILYKVSQWHWWYFGSCCTFTRYRTTPNVHLFCIIFAMFSPMLAQCDQDKVDIVHEGYRDQALMCH